MKRYTRTLFPPLDLGNTTLALRPLLIGGMVTPVNDGDGGVNCDMTADPSGLPVAVDPWLRMAEGDQVDVYWDNTLIGSAKVEAGDVDQRLFFYVPPALLVPGWVEKVFYRLTRTGSTAHEDATPLRIRVKLDLPAGVDKEPHLPGHSELAAPRLPQDVIDNGVDASWAARGIPAEIAAYPGRAAYDTVELAWNTERVAHQITPGEAAGNAPIVITVDQATILAGGDSPRLLVRYEVYDEVWNFATDWSKQTHVEVEAGARRLDAPIIAEALNGVIDLGRLGAEDVTVQIAVQGSPFARGDTVTLTWKGKTSAGDLKVYKDSLSLTNIPSIVEIKVPNAEILAIRDGSAEATYVLSKADGAPPMSSKQASVSIKGKIPLPAPMIVEAVGDTLDPTLERAHVEIPVYDHMASGDLINMIWQGTRSNGRPYVHEVEHFVTGNEVGHVIYIGVMDEHIVPLANGTLDVSYRVSNDDLSMLDVRVSNHLRLNVQTRRAELPAPSVDEAPDGVLDPESVLDYATLRVPYTGTAVGDVLTWYWQAESPDGSASDWVPITRPIQGKPITFNIPRSLIEPNINNLVKAYYSLKLAGTRTWKYSAVLDLVIGKLIGPLFPPQVLEAVNNTLDPMQAQKGATVRVRYDSMDPQDVITLVWLGTPGTGSPPDQSVSGNANGQVEFAIPAAVIGASIGKDVSVMYRVKRYRAEKLSDLLLLHIKAIADSQLPSPEITQADKQTRVLNIATFTGNATTTVGKWPFIAAGQRVWLRLEGTTPAGGPHVIVLLNGKAISGGQVGNGLSESVVRGELEKLGQDTSLTVICKVAFSETADESAALPFPSTQYRFKLHHDWVTPVISSVKDAKGEVPEGSPTFDNTLHLTGTGTIDTELDIVDGTNRLTTTRTTQSGSWTLDLTNLRPKHYSVTAKALDGSGLVSHPRTWEVKANLTPTIEQVLDARGPVSNGGTTVDSSVTLSGKASPDQQIELFDGTVSKGNATTDATGAWSASVHGLAVASHPFKAKALYGTKPESTVWTVVVATAVAPTISSIQDGSDQEIVANGFTADTSVTLTGGANANLQVEVFDGDASKGRATANAAGVWTLKLAGLSVTTHAMTAKALYGNGAVSAVRHFTIVAVVNPTLTAVIDAQSRPIANGGSTYANTVTASGQASIHQLVEVFDGALSKGTATANADGVWTRLVSGLGVAHHSLTVKALYAHRPVSSAWTFAVMAATEPRIVSIRDSKGEVTNGGQTKDTTVTASGTAAPGEQVDLYDGGTPRGTASVNAGGNWSFTLAALALGIHNVRAVAKYASNPSSNIRSFTVIPPIPDFVIDPSTVILNGRFWALSNFPGYAPTTWAPGSTYRRIPISGVAPYTFTSSNPNVVSVDTGGTIYSRGNGNAAITVRDAHGRSGSYSVNVSNVVVVDYFGNSNWPDANRAAGGRGKRIPSHDELVQIAVAYDQRWPMRSNLYWSSTPGAGKSTSRCKNMVTGGWADLKTYSFLGVGWSYADVLAI